jgi:hypothetical protein
MPFSEHFERMGGYMAKRIGAGRESLYRIPPIVSGEGFGHGASTGIANTDEKDAFFHRFHFLLRYHRSLGRLPTIRNLCTLQVFHPDDMRVEF